jgi:sugar O-acyltransferase (sialic acid O-acetyltransferase NeuD family)
MRILILGAGGHGQVIADAILCASRSGEKWALAGFLDDNAGLTGQPLSGSRVLGTISQAPDFEHDAVVIGIGDNAIRRRVFEQMRKCGARFARVIHPRATVAQDVELGEGVVVFAGAVINTGSIIGPNSIINTGATVDHHARIGAHAHIAPGSHLGGAVTLGAGVMMGIGSSVIQGRSVGEWSVVGAGAVVIRDLEAHVTAVGVPACIVGSYHSCGSEGL